MSLGRQTAFDTRDWWWRTGNVDEPHRPAADHLPCPLGCGEPIHENNQPRHIRAECDAVGGD